MYATYSLFMDPYTPVTTASHPAYATSPTSTQKTAGTGAGDFVSVDQKTKTTTASTSSNNNNNNNGAAKQSTIDSENMPSLTSTQKEWHAPNEDGGAPSLHGNDDDYGSDLNKDNYNDGHDNVGTTTIAADADADATVNPDEGNQDDPNMLPDLPHDIHQEEDHVAMGVDSLDINQEDGAQDDGDADIDGWEAYDDGGDGEDETDGAGLEVEEGAAAEQVTLEATTTKNDGATSPTTTLGEHFVSDATEKLEEETVEDDGGAQLSQDGGEDSFFAADKLAVEGGNVEIESAQDGGDGGNFFKEEEETDSDRADGDISDPGNQFEEVDTLAEDADNGGESAAADGDDQGDKEPQVFVQEDEHAVATVNITESRTIEQGLDDGSDLDGDGGDDADGSATGKTNATQRETDQAAVTGEKEPEDAKLVTTTASENEHQTNKELAIERLKNTTELETPESDLNKDGSTTEQSPDKKLEVTNPSVAKASENSDEADKASATEENEVESENKDTNEKETAADQGEKSNTKDKSTSDGEIADKEKNKEQKDRDSSPNDGKKKANKDQTKDSETKGNKTNEKAKKNKGVEGEEDKKNERKQKKEPKYNNNEKR